MSVRADVECSLMALTGSIAKTGKPECYLMAGIIAGASQIILNKKFTCIEEKCLCKGDAYCEFKLHETRIDS